MKKISICILAAGILLSLLLSGCKENNIPERRYDMNGIKIINIGHTAAGMTGAQYRIDFENQSFLTYIVRSGEEYRPPDDTAKNGGFYFVKNLKTDDIERFISKCEEYGFEDWAETYGYVENPDTHSWYIQIRYFDGTSKLISGYSVYPDTWNQMAEAFEELTGSKLLTGPPPEPTFWFFDRPVYWW